MKELFNLLIEEVALRSEVVHHTSLIGLMGILEDGNLTAFKYSTDSNPEFNEYFGNREREVAVLRRSIDRNIKTELKKDEERGKERLDSLTAGAGSGEVKIYLFNKNITSKLRGTTQRPISEYAKSYLEDFERMYENFYTTFAKMNTDVSYFQLKKEMKTLGKRLGMYKVRTKKTITAESRYFLDEVKKVMMKLDLKIQNTDKKPKEFFNRVYGLIKSLIYVYSTGDRHREGEERIVLKNPKIPGIPVSKEFMKIKIQKTFSKKYLLYSQTEDTRTVAAIEKFKPNGVDTLKEEKINKLKKFRDDLIKYKDVFLVNREYKNLIDTIEEILKGDE
jgi:hypothetical protein